MPGNVPSVEGERANLLAYLEQQRSGIRLTAFGLTDEQARSTPTASALSVGRLIKHVTATERGWLRDVLRLGVADDGEAQYGESFTMRPERRCWRSSTTTSSVVARPRQSSPASPISANPSPCRKTCRGSRRTSNRGRCDGCFYT